MCSSDLSQVIYQIIHTDPVLPTRVLPDLPKDLETIILRCLKKRAQERYLSMFEIVREIEKVLLQFTSLNIDDLVIETTSHRPTRPISASFEDLRPTLETPARGIQRGRPWAKIGAAIAGVLIIALLVVTYAITFGSHRNSEPSRPEISVLNPLSMETKEDTLAGVPERAPLPEETPPHQTQKDPTPPPPTKPVPEAGTLVVTSNRESTIMINGKKRGSFPPRMELSLPAGTYALEWVSEEGSYRETVTLEGGKVKLAHHSFPVLSYGRLTVRTPIGSPWGILYVDGEEIGPTPQNGIKLQAGTHRLEVRRDGYKTQIRDVDILEGKILAWPVTLYPVE